MKKVIFHVDVNSAFLSWEAVDRLQKGETTDLRTIPSAVCGDPKKRRGVILARSVPAKQYGVTTGEPVMTALKKCPSLTLVPPNHRLYERCSAELLEFLKDRCPVVEPFSIDECFMDMTGMEELIGEPLKAAYNLKDEIKATLGFTVNIGISENRLLAKMASDFSKPDKVHTLYPKEIKEKLWPMDAGFLYMVGETTLKKLRSIGISTIGDIAKCDPKILEFHLKSAGRTIWNYANGIAQDEEIDTKPAGKSIGNSTTTAEDIKDRETARLYLMDLCESVGTRLRSTGLKAHTVCVHFKNNRFVSYSVQRKLDRGIDATGDLFRQAMALFDKGWKKDPLRLIGVTVSSLGEDSNMQLSILEKADDYEKSSRLDRSIDALREKYGKDILKRAALLKKDED
jgi:DNA polymerase-4